MGNSLNIREIIVLLSLFIILGGCVSSKTAPVNDSGFSKITEIKQLVGCYKNLGESGDDFVRRYLTQILWPEREQKWSSELDEKIAVVRVVLASSNSLNVTGESEGIILKEKTFTEGQDFKIESGKIIIKNNLTFGGDVFIGIGHESSILGLDEHGNGRLEDSLIFAGTGFLVIPLAAKENHSIRFNKTTDCALAAEPAKG